MNDNELDLSDLEDLEIIGLQPKNPNAIGYMARWFVLTNFPYNEVDDSVYRCTNGKCTLSIIAPHEGGIPFGVIPRLLINWVVTKAVIRKEKKVVLGNSLGAFLSELDIEKGGKVYERFKDQMVRTFSCAYAFSDDVESPLTEQHAAPIVDSLRYWWDQTETKEPAYIVLSDAFYEEIIEHPVPMSMKAVKNLKNSAMALDVYAWLKYYMPLLTHPVLIPWKQLHHRFGPSYGQLRDFKIRFVDVLKRVQKVYPQAHIYVVNLGGPRKGLLLNPFPSQG